ncbi:MAG: PTS sugar transporter subunit IIC [Defluviitaleaceae bacterium]|nr:PTS sugar transporter subunit IIC [Defluviitaleaceae bacterium]MCL2835891.1 PTS sugar transporter subunit IIC [Defluviitaleaceae bacterium]
MKIRTYLAKVFDGMAKGLFASLIIGVIIKQIGDYTGIAALQTFGQAAQFLMGPAIGAGIALSRKAPMFTLLAAIAAGAIGAGSIQFLEHAGVWGARVGDPIGALLAALIGIEIGKKLEGKTKFDLLIIPALVILSATLVGVFISPPVARFMELLGNSVNRLTDLQPIPLGILIGISVGMILTSPISSAALCIGIQIGGPLVTDSSIAAGAALAGCCAQMIGFAVISFRENKWSGLISQGLGTSMLQMPNIIKNPWVWLPPTIASGVGGFLSAVVFGMRTNSTGAGMGTSGLVGPFTAYAAMEGGRSTVAAIAAVHFISPAVVSLIVCELMRKRGLIKFGDLRL